MSSAPNPPCLLLLPSYNGQYDGLLERGLNQITAHGWLEGSNVWKTNGGSNIQRVREDGFHHWLTQTAYDWAVWIDADIGFTDNDWELLWEDDTVEAVCATYPAKKQSGLRVVEFGFGFCRISRHLMEEIDDLTREDGTSIALRYRYSPADGAAPEEYVEYCPQGARVLEGQWVAEDHAFWILAKLTGAPMRIENRCRLIHTGLARWYGGEADPLRPERTDLTER